MIEANWDWKPYAQRVRDMDSTIRSDESYLRNLTYDNNWKKGTEGFYRIVDTICTTHDDFKGLLEMLYAQILKADTLIVTYWEEDRETCLYNDKGRRERSSEVTIKTAKYEKPTLESIAKDVYDILGIANDVEDKQIKIKLNRMLVQEKPGYMAQFSEYIRFEPAVFDGKLRSDTYTLGGSHRLLDGTTRPIEPDTPEEFTELEDLLEKHFPNITFIQYKQLKRELVEFKTQEIHDYYTVDGSEGYWEIDLEKLYDWLIDHGIIKLD